VLADPRIGGFEVTSVVDRPAHKVRIAIDEFLDSRTPQNLVVVYFSCHGVTVAHRLHFAATDTFKSRLASTGVDSVWVHNRLEVPGPPPNSDLGLLLQRRLRPGSRGRRGPRPGPVHRAGTGPCRAHRLQCHRIQLRNLDQSAAHRRLTRTWLNFHRSLLVAGLRDGSADRDGDSFVTVDEAYEYAYHQVHASGAAQIPQRWFSGGEGDLLLARNPTGRPVIPEAIPESLRAGLESPWPNIRIGAIDELSDSLTSDDPSRGRVRWLA
jgi:hypothetical protein